MKVVNIVTLFLASTLAISSAAAYEDELLQQLSPHGENIELTEQAVIIDNNWIVSDELIDKQNFRAQVVLIKNETTKLITKGDVLLSAGELGLLDEVLTATVQNNTILLETKPAKLLDAVKNLQISM